MGVFFNGVFLAGDDFFAGLLAFNVCVPFLKLVDLRAVALNLMRTFSEAEIGFGSLSFVRLLAGSLIDFAVFFVGAGGFFLPTCLVLACDEPLTTFDAVATLVIFALLMVLVLVFVVDLAAALVLFATVTFFLTWTDAFFLLRADLALETAFVIVLDEALFNIFRFLFKEAVDSSRTFASLRFFPASDFLSLLLGASLFCSAFDSLIARSLGRGPRTPRQVGAPQRHCCTFFWEYGLRIQLAPFCARSNFRFTHSKL